MRRSFPALALACVLGAAAAAQEMDSSSAAEIVARQESAANAAFRYRAAIAGLLPLKAGVVAAEIGAGSGFVARAMASQVGADGRVIAVTLDPRLVAYINDRARADGTRNLAAVLGRPDAAGLDPVSIDAAAVVNAFSGFTRQAAMLQSIAAALKPGGTLLIVDIPREGVGNAQVGIDADDVVALAAAAGFIREAESSVVPGQYAIRFKKR
jgi:cyclopropane fatty-acyl-phospholipid synthase-like methyltransferase